MPAATPVNIDLFIVSPPWIAATLRGAAWGVRDRGHKWAFRRGCRSELRSRYEKNRERGSLLRRRDMENPLGRAVTDLLALVIGERRLVDPRDGRRRRLIGIVDRPHDVVSPDLVDAVAERQRVLHAALWDL